MMLLKIILAPVILLFTLLVILGVVYPFIVWGVSHLISADKAEGSIVDVCGVQASYLVSHYNDSNPLFRPLPPDNTSSGVDPYVPLPYALAQVDRVSNYTKIPKEILLDLIYQNVAENEVRNLYVFSPGYYIVNVEELNMEIIRILNKTCSG
ncbi:potassium-transporting ATPase subunit C [Thermogladius sp. 4427co]|uniref:potassium-transporting ATPase subunit C n=1 Tax=Thermogladius sp. 4427co TaxID=3450718 RepID=UPI003F78B802